MCLIYFMNQSNQLKGITLFLRSLVSRQTPVNSTKWNGISLSKKKSAAETEVQKTDLRGRRRNFKILFFSRLFETFLLLFF